MGLELRVNADAVAAMVMFYRQPTPNPRPTIIPGARYPRYPTVYRGIIWVWRILWPVIYTGLNFALMITAKAAWLSGKSVGL